MIQHSIDEFIISSKKNHKDQEELSISFVCNSASTTPPAVQTIIPFPIRLSSTHCMYQGIKKATLV